MDGMNIFGIHTKVGTVVVGVLLAGAIAGASASPLDRAALQAPGSRTAPSQPATSDASQSLPAPTIDPASRALFPPRYPPALAEAGEMGTVVLIVRVSPEGRVDVELEKSSGFPRVDQLAFEAVSLWSFQPAVVEGKPVASAVRIPMNFSPN
jgi:protein TonB